MSKAKAEKFISHDYALFLKKQSLIAADGRLLYRWCGTHWVAVDTDAGEKKAYEWLASRNKIWATPRNAQTAYQSAILSADPLPPITSANVIPTQSGYIHIENAQLVRREPDPKLGLRHCLACAYEPERAAPARFTAFLERVLPDPGVRARVQEYIGYTLLGDARYQRAQFWLGVGANGKGVLANIVQALHGHVAAVGLNHLDGFRLSGLVDASLIYVDETPRKPINEQQLKSLIAGERVFIDRKYRESVSIAVQAKWLVLGNHLPVITDHSVGFWRRWDVIPFDVVIPEREREPLLADTIIREELSGVLNWALQGLVRLLQRGRFDVVVPEAMKMALGQAKMETNSVVAWIEDRNVQLQTQCTTSKEAVFLSYRRWCERNAMREVSSVQFWKRLREQFTALDIVRARNGGAPQRMCNIDVPGLNEHLMEEM